MKYDIVHTFFILFEEYERKYIYDAIWNIIIFTIIVFSRVAAWSWRFPSWAKTKTLFWSLHDELCHNF